MRSPWSENTVASITSSTEPSPGMSVARCSEAPSSTWIPAAASTTPSASRAVPSATSSYSGALSSKSERNACASRARGRSLPRTRSQASSADVSRWTANACSARAARVALAATAPPPSSRTIGVGRPRSSAAASASSSRKRVSPRSEKSSGMLFPVCASTCASTDTNARSSRAATCGPRVVLPAPMKPTSAR